MGLRLARRHWQRPLWAPGGPGPAGYQPEDQLEATVMGMVTTQRSLSSLRQGATLTDSDSEARSVERRNHHMMSVCTVTGQV
jgi:hypothetical protein